MYEELWAAEILIPVGKRKKDGHIVWDSITKEELKFLIQDEKRRLGRFEALRYYERYSGEEMAGIPEFEFQGYDILEKHFGMSAITDCDYLSAENKQKLNRYRLFDNFEDAKQEQSRIRTDYLDQENADCEVFGIWCYSP